MRPRRCGRPPLVFVGRTARADLDPTTTTASCVVVVVVVETVFPAFATALFARRSLRWRGGRGGGRRLGGRRRQRAVEEEDEEGRDGARGGRGTTATAMLFPSTRRRLTAAAERLAADDAFADALLAGLHIINTQAAHDHDHIDKYNEK